MSISHEIFEKYRLLCPPVMRNSLTVSRAELDLSKHLIQTLLDDEAQVISFSFGSKDEQRCPFRLYITPVDNDMSLSSDTLNYISVSNNIHLFNGYDSYRDKRNSLILFFAICLRYSKPTILEQSLENFCLSHCSKVYIEFVEVFFYYVQNVSQWGALEDEVCLWIIDIFMQYLGCKENDYFNVETVFQGLSHNVFKSLNIDDNQRSSLRDAIKTHTIALFKDYNRLDNGSLLKVLSIICTIISQNNLNSKIVDFLLKNKKSISSALYNYLGSGTYFNCSEITAFNKICNSFNNLELNV